MSQAGARFVELKRCCTVCDAKKVCHICRGQTLWACSDCAIDLSATIHICASNECRNAHEEKCSARLREERESLQSKLTQVEQERDKLKASRRVHELDNHHNALACGYCAGPLKDELERLKKLGLDHKGE